MESWQLIVNIDLENIMRTFKIYFFDPRAVESDQKKDFLSEEIVFGIGNSGLQNKINDYFEGAFGSSADTAVTSVITYYNAEGTVITCSDLECNNPLPTEGSNS